MVRVVRLEASEWSSEQEPLSKFGRIAQMFSRCQLFQQRHHIDIIKQKVVLKPILWLDEEIIQDWTYDATFPNRVNIMERSLYGFFYQKLNSARRFVKVDGIIKLQIS